jgi:spore germination protein KB
MGQDIKQRERLSNVQIFAMMTRLILAAALLGVYRAIMEESGRDAWISLILGAVVIAIAIVIIYNLNKHYPELTIIEYTQLILGKWGGRIVGLAFVLYLLFVSGMLLRFFGELVNTWILRETPLMVILGTTLILTVYLASKGLTTLGRYCIIITILMFWVEIFLFFLAPQWEIKNLLPIGKAGSKSILSGILPSIFAFGGY